MLGPLQAGALVILCTFVTAISNAHELLARQGQTVALGVVGASVHYDEVRGSFLLTATITEPLGGTPIRLVASLQLGQALSISVPGQAGKPVTQVRLTRTQDGLDISYPSPAAD